MEYTLIIHALAAEDMIEIARWYDLQLPGLGNRFEQQLERPLAVIQKQPTAHNKANGETRKAFLKNPHTSYFSK